MSNYKPDAWYNVNQTIKRTEQRLEKLKLRRAIADIDRKLAALKNLQEYYPDQGSTHVALDIGKDGRSAQALSDALGIDDCAGDK
jgi:hypothetical protein